MQVWLSHLLSIVGIGYFLSIVFNVFDNNVPTKNGRPIFSMFIQYPWQTNMNFELPLFRFKLKC